MKTIAILLAQILVFSSAVFAELPTSTPAAQQELGKWWKDSEVVRQLQLSEAQIEKIEQTFLHFRPALATLSAELRSREAELKSLMSANSVDEARIRNQTDLIAVSRASLEKTNSSMMLEIRKDLSKQQWDRLQEIQALRRSSAALSATTDTAHIGDDEVYRVGGTVKAPRVLYQPLPSYTQEARDAKAEGIVLLQGIVRKNGRITDLQVLRGIGYGLDQKAIETITNEWRFEPGTRDGQPVDVQVNLEVSFRRY